MILQEIRKKIGQIFCLHQAFCHPHQNQDLDQHVLALINYFFFIMVKTWFTTETVKSAWPFNLSKSTVSSYIITWASFTYFRSGCVPVWPT